MNTYKQFKETQILIDKSARKYQESYPLPKFDISIFFWVPFWILFGYIFLLNFCRVFWICFSFTIPDYFLWILASIILVLGISYIWLKLFSLYQSRFFQKLLHINTKLYQTLTQIDAIESVIEHLEAIKRIISRFYRIKKYLTIGKGGIDDIVNNCIVQETNWLISIIKYLQSDLLTNIENQKINLLQAKFEVEQTIKGSTELEQVSELQQARLNRQIKQFEELQRVLVKT